MDQYLIYFDKSKSKTQNYCKEFSLKNLQSCFGILIFRISYTGCDFDEYDCIVLGLDWHKSEGVNNF